MIRVGFVLAYTDSNWVGGINYLSNLLHAISRIRDRKIEPILIVSPNTPDKVIAAFPPCKVLRTVLAAGGNSRWGLMRKLGERLLGRDVLMERFLRANGINVLSHSGQLGRNATIPTIGWLADFQHRRMPEFFQPNEIAARDRGCRRISQQCTTVLLSSFDAQRDLEQFDPTALSRSQVLQFVAGFAGGDTPCIDEAVLRAKYELTGPYFHLPNQFWVHKNHRVVIEALAILKGRGLNVIVVCTGQTKDRRWPQYFDELMQLTKDKDLNQSFQVLGLVPYSDMTALMKNAVAVINPSLFEGWSTTVEESKSLGLNVILSDIPVHREQNPKYGLFFDPHDAQSLADVLIASFNEKRIRTKSAVSIDIKKRFSEFGENYQVIVIKTYSSNKPPGDIS